MSSFDTIAAISTALSESGIGIIRVSGPDAIDLVNKIFVTPGDRHILRDVMTHTIHYGYVIDPDITLDESVVEPDKKKGSIYEHIDECLVSVMKGPRSFTGEDVVEINCHGGVYVVKKVLSLVLKTGARLADPGEFSKRAFLNGRLDLAEAEAVMDVISSKSDSALKASVRQLSGMVSSKIRSLREEILYNIAFIESALDDPEHISIDGYSDKLITLLDKWLAEVDKLISSNDSGRFLREGIKTVLLGKPNAGKSSVMNLLLGQDRAIVTDIAGTTRDTLEEFIKFGDIGLNLIDTAGIRESENAVEQIGVDRAKKAADEADLILYVADVSDDITDGYFDEYLNMMESLSDIKGIILLNKMDVFDESKDTGKVYESGIKAFVDKAEKYGFPIVEFSAVTGLGYEKLKLTIGDLFLHGLKSDSDEVIITNIRHRQCLEECRNSLLNVKHSALAGMEEDFYSIDLMDAYASLGKIIGEEIEDDLATEIFSKFCLGK